MAFFRKNVVYVYIPVDNGKFSISNGQSFADVIPKFRMIFFSSGFLI